MNKLVGFVQESNRIEGIHRGISDPQTGREIEVHEWFLRLEKVTVADLESFVHVIQPDAVLRRQIGLDVRVGNHIAPRGGPEIERRLEAILAVMDSPYKTHLAYEDLHPFTDGNGRSGRVLWLWQMGGEAPIGFLHRFYYQALDAAR